MATYFKNVLKSSLGTSEAKVLTTANNAKTTVIGLSLSNLTGSIILASVRILDENTLASAYYVKEIVIPPNQSARIVNGGERLVLSESTSVLIQANQDNSLDLVLSYVEIL